MPRGRGAVISNIQLLRGLAALGVVLMHTDYRLFGGDLTTFLGVEIFFVISGFIMTYITREGADGFLVNRIIRIVPLYWLATITYVVWIHAWLNWLPGALPIWADWIVHDPGRFGWWLQAVLAHAFAFDTLPDLAQKLLFLPY